ncbi:MAG TPA: molybdopterin oxidoreductase family protein [Candidatus Binatia bacterium]|jgi:anaerobic selenocysteine-containing dehydrogenase|nr:molybdopterin oxidoreductase family protein [Candidatus Binatia bacterium]
MDETTAVHHRTCSLCEATCGLEITTRGRTVTGIRGDDADPFSHGYLCPKGPALKHLDADPDRLRQPLVRRGDRFDAVSWDDAFAEIDRRLPPIVRDHGRDAVAVYLGNPSAHSLALMLYPRALLRVLGTQNVYSASTVDQMPKQISSGYMFGTALSVPIPDIDRTSWLLILGADPVVSNGSLMTAPDVKDRLRAIRGRGGKVVVVDPRRSRTADEASEHHFIRPGTDALLLMAMAHTIVAEGLVALGRLAPHTAGLAELEGLTYDFTPEACGPVCGIEPDVIRRLARELAGAPHGAVYGRIGTCTQEFGTLASWLVDVLNVLTGNLDCPGGAMFTKAAAGAANTRGIPGRGKGIQIGRRHSRVRGMPEVLGELPAACLAEEIETPGAGQVRALITIAGNPALSNPNGARLARALGSLDFMLSFDIYLNETTRHADVILPGLSPLESPHYDLALWQLAIRNYANYSPPVFPPPPDRPTDWEAILRVTGIVMGQGPAANTTALDDMIAQQQVDAALGAAASPIAGRDGADIMAALAPRRGPERLLDLMLRTGPYGDAFGATPDGLTLAVLEANPHGIDLGALEQRIPEVLRTPSGKIELTPPEIVKDIPRLREKLAPSAPHMTLVGRRDLRSNNSWMHNIESLVRGEPRCTLWIHPDDAGRLGLSQGASARLTSRAGALEVPVEITDAIMPGVVSMPHGWGHDSKGSAMRIATAHAGVNSNLLTDEHATDPLSGNAVLNGIPVEIEAATPVTH